MSLGIGPTREPGGSRFGCRFKGGLSSSVEAGNRSRAGRKRIDVDSELLQQGHQSVTFRPGK